LALVGDLSGRDADRVVEEALEAARRRFFWIEDLAPYGALVRRLVGQEALKPFFFLSPGAEVYQEKEVVDAQGRTKRIDRLIVGKSEVSVVDYKSSREDAAGHHAQVREYLRLVAQAVPDRKARGFIVYLDDAGLEEVHG
jgi:ATP-dependent exoDNAse (exonuclease V) beta subunit